MFKRSKKEVSPKAAKEFSNIDWEVDLNHRLRLSEKRAWNVTKFLSVLTILLVIAIVFLIPLRKVVPYVVTVDKLTGEAMTILPSQKDFMSVSQKTLNDKHWIKDYVIAHERYNYRFLQSDYDKVKLLSNSSTWSDYATRFEGSGALQNKYGENVTVVPNILSITLDGTGIARVSFESVFKATNDPTPKISRKVATLRYAYSTGPRLRESDAIDNPLGFNVISYQVVDEFASSN